jgi:hypothetical protein
VPPVEAKGAADTRHQQREEERRERDIGARHRVLDPVPFDRPDHSQEEDEPLQRDLAAWHWMR